LALTQHILFYSEYTLVHGLLQYFPRGTLVCNNILELAKLCLSTLVLSIPTLFDLPVPIVIARVLQPELVPQILLKTFSNVLGVLLHELETHFDLFGDLDAGVGNRFASCTLHKETLEACQTLVHKIL